MLTFVKWLAAAAAPLGLLILWSAQSAKAADVPAGKGTVTGTVLDKEGKGVAGAEVTLSRPILKRQAKLPRPVDKAAPDRRAEVIAKATTDADGMFTIKDVPAGDYMIACRVEGKGVARATVTVAADQTVTVKLQLKEIKPGRRGAAR